jgi:hypothetical protein
MAWISFATTITLILTSLISSDAFETEDAETRN